MLLSPLILLALLNPLSLMPRLVLLLMPTSSSLSAGYVTFLLIHGWPRLTDAFKYDNEYGYSRRVCDLISYIAGVDAKAQ